MTQALSLLTSGAFPLWGIFVVAVITLAGMVTAYIKGVPDRQRAATEATKVTGDQHAEQIKELREELRRLTGELHSYVNDLQIMGIRLNKSESESRRRGDLITNMTFIIRLLISELRRLDPNSVIVAQAEALMAQMTAPTPDTPLIEGDGK